jgi:translation elongation factor P/translation initiation factor 5A
MQRAAQGVLDVVNASPPTDEAFVRLEQVSAFDGEKVKVRFWASKLVENIWRETRRNSGFRRCFENEAITTEV